jgi:hypothetical protein
MSDIKYHHIVFLILLGFFSPCITTQAQWIREPALTLGIVKPNYDQSSFYYQTPGAMVKLGYYQTWFRPDKKISLRPEVGLNSNYFSFDYENGGKGAYSRHDGKIITFNCEAAVLAQLKIFPAISIAIGPSAQHLITELTNTIRIYDGHIIDPGVYTENKTNGFSRFYLNKPSIGLKLMVLQKNLNNKIRIGMTFNYQKKKLEEKYFHFSSSREISVYVSFISRKNREL